MLSKRVIPCLDVRDGKLTKGIKFKGNVDIGDPVETARIYYEEGADELVFYDITASSEGRGIMLDVVDKVASQIFIPFSVGGGISTVEDMPRQIPKKGTSFSLAYPMAAILPSIPRAPKPPGTSMPSMPAKMAPALSRVTSSELT